MHQTDAGTKPHSKQCDTVCYIICLSSCCFFIACFVQFPDARVHAFSSCPKLCLLFRQQSIPLLDADGTRNRQRHVMSSVDMNALFGRVANEGPPQELQANDHHSHAMNDSLPELLRPSSSTLLDALSVPIPDSFYDQRAPSNHAFLVNTQGQRAHSERLLRASRPARWPSSLCHSAAPSGAESHSGESEAAAHHVRMASSEQPCLGAKSSSSGARSNSSGAKCSATDVVATSAAVRDSEMHSGPGNVAAAVPFAQGLQTVQQALTHPDGFCQNLRTDSHPQPAVPGSQMTSRRQEPKHEIKQGVKPEAQNANTSSAASSLATSWPRVSHVGKLRHGKQLRQAAAEAAAAAAGQAARAESAVRLQTPPTIAFHSIAAKHAMLAAEAAAAAAAVTADSTVQGAAISPKHRAGDCNTQLLGWAGQLPASALRAERLHASAPASPVCHGKHSSSALVGQYAGPSMDPADVQAPRHAQHQHASRGECPDVLELFGNVVLPNTASAPATSVTRAAGNTVWEEQQGQDSFLSSCSDGLLADAHCHHLPQQRSRQSVQSTEAGWKLDTSASQHAQCGQQAQLAQHGQRSQRGQQAQHVQQATWEQEGTHPMEDPFKASEQFPICPDLCLSLPNSEKQDSWQSCLLTDCTNQMANLYSRHCRAVRPPPESQSQQCSRSGAAVTAAFKDSMAPHQGTYQHDGERRCEQALSMRAESGGRAELATERLSSLTEHDFWEAARAELLDTAEPVRHRSCISELDTACPSEMSKLSMVADKMQHTPEPRMNKGPVPPSGITPLLCKSKSCAQGCCNEGCCMCCKEECLLLTPSANLIIRCHRPLTIHECLLGLRLCAMRGHAKHTFDMTSLSVTAPVTI